MKKILFFCFIALAAMAGSPPAQAALNAVGPNDPSNGFPVYYQDGNGLGLAQCLDKPAGGLEPCLGLTPADAVPGVWDPTAPIAFPSNFPPEFFFWTGSIDATGTPADAYITVIEFALEGAFSAENPAPNTQVVFTRNRFRFTPPNVNASYTVEHPFGSITFNPPYDGGVVNHTEDIGVADGIFTGALNGNVGPFLRWDDSLPAPPAGYIGDPAIAHTVTGAVNNFVRIIGPDAGGPGVNSITLTNFNLAGKLFGGALPTALTVHRANLVRNATTGRIDIFANSQPSAAVKAVAGASFPAGDQILTGDASGQFFKAVNLGDPATVPATVGITASSPNNTDTTIFKSVTDKIDVTLAEYDVTAKTLKVNATTSDAGTTSPVLTVQGFSPGTMTMAGGTGTLTIPNLDVPPNEVTVTSSSGGSHTQDVSVVAGTPVPGGPSITSTAVIVGTVGQPYTYQVTATDTSPGTLGYSLPTAPAGMTINPTTGLITWTPTSAQTGPNPVIVRVTNATTTLSATQTFSVNVSPAPVAETLAVSRAEFRSGNSELRVAGTSTLPNQTVTLFWGAAATPANQIGTATVGATGAFTFRQSGLTRPAGTTQITIRSSVNTTATFSLTVR